MLSATAFDAVYEYAQTTVAGTPIHLTTGGKDGRRTLKASFWSGGGMYVVATFRADRTFLRRQVTATLELDGREVARNIKHVSELKHAFDRALVAKVIEDLERQARQLGNLTTRPTELGAKGGHPRTH